jgi:hypothetical protein
MRVKAIWATNSTCLQDMINKWLEKWGNDINVDDIKYIPKVNSSIVAFVHFDINTMKSDNIANLKSLREDTLQ